MSLEKPHPRSKRPSIEHEEERAWVSFYKRVGNDLALATEVLAQLDSAPDMKRSHLALYLCCKESLRTHKARQARNKRIGIFVRWFCGGLFTQLFVQWPKAWRRALRQGAGGLPPAENGRVGRTCCCDRRGRCFGPLPGHPQGGLMFQHPWAVPHAPPVDLP